MSNRVPTVSLRETTPKEVNRELARIWARLSKTDSTDTVAASEDHTVNATFDSAEVKAALDALGAKINELIRLLA